MMRINFDAEDVARVKLLLDDIDAKRVMVRAINRTLDGVQTDAVRFISTDLNLTQARIREDFYINRAVFERITGSVVARGRPVNFASFIGTTETISDWNGGLSVKLKKSGSRERFKHGFLWTRPAGSFRVNTASGGISQDTARTAFERDAPPYHTFRSRFSPWKRIFPERPAVAGKRRLKTLTGPRIEDELDKDRVMNSVMIEAQGRIDTNMDHELEYILSRH